MPLVPRYDALGNKINPNAAPEPPRKLRPVSGLFNGERLPIVGTSDDGDHVFELPWQTDDDKSRKVYVANNRDGGLPRFYEKTKDGKFSFAGHLDDGLREGDSGVLPRIHGPTNLAPPPNEPDDGEPLPLLRKPNTLGLLKSRNPEKFAEAQSLLKQADDEDNNATDIDPGQGDYYRTQAYELLQSIMPQGGYSKHASIAEQLERGILRQTPPHVVSPSGRVTFLPTPKPRTDKGDDRPADEAALAAEHQRAREAFAKAQLKVDMGNNIAGRLTDRFVGGVNSVTGAGVRLFDGELADELNRNQAARAAALDAEGGRIERTVGGAVRSAGVMAGAAPAVALGGAAVAPAAFAGSAGLSTANTAYTEAKDLGLTPGQSLTHAGLQGGIEAGMSLLFSKFLKLPGAEGALSRGLGQNLTDATKKKIVGLAAAKVLKAGVEEVPEELATAVAQNLASRLTVDPGRAPLTADEAADIIAQSMIAGSGMNVPSATLDAAQGVRQVNSNRAADKAISEYKLPPYQPQGVTPAPAADPTAVSQSIAQPSAPKFGQKGSVVSFTENGAEQIGTITNVNGPIISVKLDDGRTVLKRLDSLKPVTTPDAATPAEQPAEQPQVSAQRALADYVSSKDYNNPRRAELREMDQEYVRLKQAADVERKAEVRADATEAAKATREANTAEREAAQQEIAAGNVTPDNVRFAPMGALHPELRSRMVAEAKRLTQETSAPATLEALNRIIKGEGDTSAATEAQKQRIITKLLGQEQQNGVQAQRQAPRPADPIVELLLKPVDQRQADFAKALKQFGVGAPHPLLSLAKSEASAEINEGLDLDEEPRQPTREEVRSKLAEIADRVGVALEGRTATAKTVETDDSFDFGANTAEPEAKAEAAEATPKKIVQDNEGDDFNLAPLEEEVPEVVKQAQALPPVQPGYVRMYHGGTGYGLEGKRWLTPDPVYAQGYADKSGGTVQYVDIPESDPRLLKSYDDEGTGQKAPYMAFEADEETSKRLKPLVASPTQPAEPGKRPLKKPKATTTDTMSVNQDQTPPTTKRPLRKPVEAKPEASGEAAGTQSAPEVTSESAQETASPKAATGSEKATDTVSVKKRPLRTLEARYRDETGHDLGQVGVEPTEEQAEVAKLFTDRGLKVQWFKSPSGVAANSFHDPHSGVTYLNSDLTAENGLHYLVAHEFSHASGADQRLDDLPAEILAEAKQRYAEGASPNYLKKLHADESLWRREAVARYMGEVFADPKLRAKVRTEQPTLWKKIVEFVRSLFKEEPALPPHVQRVLDEFAPPPKAKPSDTTPPTEPPTSKPSGSSGDRYDRYSGFANPLKGTDAGAMADAVAENMGANPKPKWTREQLTRDARAKYDADPAAARKEIDEALASGQPLTAEQTALVNIIKTADATAALNSGKPEDLERFNKLQQAYLRQRSETGSALAAGKVNLFATPEGRQTLIAEELVELTPDEAKRLKKLTETLRSGDKPRGFLFGDAPRPGRRPGTHETIEDMVTDIRRGKDPNRLYVDLAPVDETEAAKIKEATGLDVEGYVHSVDGAAIKHVLKVHGDPKEALRGQVPVTPEDFNHIPEIIAEPDEIEAGELSALKLPTILYRKRIGDVFYYVEELRTGRRKLAAKSLYKRKASPSSVDPTRETTDSLKSATDAELSDASGSIGPSRANVKSDSPLIQEAATPEGQARIDAIRAEIKSILGGRRFSQLSAEEDAKVKDLAKEAVDLGAKGPKGRAKAEAELKAKQEQGDDPGLLLGDSPVWKDNILTALSTWQPKGTPAQLLAHIEKTKGAKDQAKWIGLDDFLKDKPSVTRAEVEQFVRDNAVEVQEVTKGSKTGYNFVGNEWQIAIDAAEARGDWDEAERINRAWEGLDSETGSAAGQTKYQQYQLPGGENYKELLLTLPPKEEIRTLDQLAKLRGYDGWHAGIPEAEQKRLSDEYNQLRAAGKTQSNYSSSHFDEKNIVAHARFNERTDTAGKKTLFLEEVQSDWHQAGKRHGYAGDPVDTSGWTAPKLTRGTTPGWMVYDDKNTQVGWIMQSNAPTAADAIRLASELRSNNNSKRVPDAPFKQTWPMLAVKRMIRYAADHGFDQIAWTTGEQQADRYDLAKQIERIEYHSDSDGSGTVIAYAPGGRDTVIRRNVENPEQELPDIIGKEATEKLLNAPKKRDNGIGRDTRVLNNADLKVGGEGMRGFYDKILPAEVNKFAKKFGSKVGSTQIETERDASDYKIERNGEGYRIMEYDPAANRWSMRETAPTMEAAENRLNEIATHRTVEVHALPITDAMKADAAQGMLLFADKKDPLETVIGEKTPEEQAKTTAAKRSLKKPTTKQQAEAELKRLEAEIAERQKAFKERMEAIGVLPKDAAGYAQLVADPVATRKAIIEMRAHKSTAPQKLLEYWYSAILSGIPTHSKNVNGNVVNGTWTGLEGLAKMGLEVGTLQKSPLDAVNELRSFWAGAIPGIIDGWRNAREAFSTEVSPLATKIGGPQVSALEGTEGVAAIPGRLGRVIRLPKRVMLATDEFFKTLVTQLNVGVEAYRIAREEGLDGAAASKRQVELSADPTSPAWERAYQTALEVTFQEEGGDTRQKIKKTISSLREVAPTLSRFLIPFTNIAINGAAQTVQRSPVGIIYMIAHAYDNVKNGRHALTGMSDEFAKQAVGLMLTSFVYHAVGDDDEKKFAITGKNSKEHPYSIRIGSRYYTYSGIEPLASFFGLIADGVESWKQNGSAISLLGDTLKSVGSQAAEKPILGAVSDAARLLTSEQGYDMSAEGAVNAAAEWAARFGGSFVPAIAKTPVRATRDVTPERKQWGKPGTAERFGQLVDRTLARTDLGLIEEAAKRDKWGRAYPETVFEGHPVTDALFRIFSPTKVSQYQPHPGDLLLAKWNRTNPDAEISIAPLSPYYEVNGRKRYLTDAQYGKLLELTGKIADRMFRESNYDPANPTAEQVEALKDGFSAAADAARDHMKRVIGSGYRKELDVEATAKTLRIKAREQALNRLDTALKPRKVDESAADFAERKAKWLAEREQIRAFLKRTARPLKPVSVAGKNY